MIITFYDKDFNALADNSSLNIELPYTLVRRAYDLNEFSCTCEPISLDIEPMFATMKNNDGTRYYDMLRPIIKKDSEGQSTVIARDLYGIFNTECVIDMTVKKSTVKEYLQYIFDSWKAWDKSGFENVSLNLDLVTTSAELIKPMEKSVYNVKDLFSKAMAYYDLFIDSEIDMRNKTLKFKIAPNNLNTLRIRLEDFGIEDFAKYEPNINTAIAMNEDFTIRHNWFLLQNGAITTNSTLRNIFPTSAKIFTNEDVNEADFEAVMELAENRYQETIEINIVKDYDRLKDISFDTNFEIYYNGLKYKILPLGEIEEDGTRNRILRIGFKPVDFIQII